MIEEQIKYTVSKQQFAIQLLKIFSVLLTWENAHDIILKDKVFVYNMQFQIYMCMYLFLLNRFPMDCSLPARKNTGVGSHSLLQGIFPIESNPGLQHYRQILYHLSRQGSPIYTYMYSCLENPMDGGAWQAIVHGVSKNRTRLSDFPFTFHFHALEKEMATHSSVLAWRIPGTGEPGGCRLWGHTELDTTEATQQQQHSYIGEGKGNPLQQSCLENPMDRGSWRVGYSPWGHKELDMTE